MKAKDEPKFQGIDDTSLYIKPTPLPTTEEGTDEAGK
jgi:hypothetical protein